MSKPKQIDDITVICLGSNVTDRLDRLHDALASLRQWCHVQDVSDYYEAPDDSGLGAPYVNVVLSCVPLVDKDELCEHLKALEIEFGRSLTSKTDGVMPLDADIVVWHGEIVDPYEFSRPYFRQGFENLSINSLTIPASTD